MPTPPPSKIACEICQRQFAKYTCPTCNVGYCSMTCFRSETHSQCSETFYRKQIDSEIRTQPSRSAEERLKMLELLKRFEEQSKEDELLLEEEEGDGDGDDDGDLAKRFSGVDIGTASSDAVWSRLTTEERKKFFKIFANPSSRLAQELLTSEEAEREQQAPWWETPYGDDNGRTRFGMKPKMMEIPRDVAKSLPDRPCLVYNISAVGIAYVYATRHFCRSPLSLLKHEDGEIEQVRGIISQLVPILVDRKSKTLYTGLSEVVTEMWSRIDSVTGPTFSLLIQDTARILRPANVTEMGLHPSHNAILMLSDLWEVFENSEHIRLKLVFYGGQLIATPVGMMRTVSDELMRRSYDCVGT